MVIVSQVSPLVRVDGSKVTGNRIGPFIPNGDPVLEKVIIVGAATQKPQQLMHDGLEVDFLGGKQREALRQIVAELVAEYRAGAGAGSVGAIFAVGEDVL